MTIYEQLKQHFHLPTAYDDWSDYRNTLTNYLIKQTDSSTIPLCFSANLQTEQLLPSLLVVGAGAGNDLNLADIASHFSNITLLDFDSKLLKSSLHTHSLDNCDKINLSITNITGLTDTVYESFCCQLSDYIYTKQLLGEPITTDKFDEYSSTLLKTALEQYVTYDIPLQKNTYDYVWCFGVHSQLFTMFSYIHHAYCLNLQHMYEDFKLQTSSRFDTILKAENDHFIPHFNDALLACAKQKVFIGLETSHSPIEGSYQGITDLEQRNLVKDQHYIIWPFRPADNIYYKMQITEITIKE